MIFIYDNKINDGRKEGGRYEFVENHSYEKQRGIYPEGKEFITTKLRVRGKKRSTHNPERFHGVRDLTPFGRSHAAKNSGSLRILFGARPSQRQFFLLALIIVSRRITLGRCEPAGGRGQFFLVVFFSPLPDPTRKTPPRARRFSNDGTMRVPAISISGRFAAAKGGRVE